MRRSCRRRLGLLVVAAALTAGCAEAPPTTEITLVVAGQALIKADPRLSWQDPFGSLRPIVQAADVAFTNFEMAVKSGADACGVPDDYEVFLPGTDQPVVEFMWNIGHTLRPNGEILEGNPVMPEVYVLLTRENFRTYHSDLLKAALDRLAQFRAPARSA